MTHEPVETMWAGKYIEARRQGRWEFVGRANNIHAAVILAIDNGDILLVEQHRVPLGGTCLELPAGLVGDVDKNESVEISARSHRAYRPLRLLPWDALGDLHSGEGAWIDQGW